MLSMISFLVYAKRVNKQLLAYKTLNFKQLARNLEVHEHVAYTLLKEAGVPIPPFGVAKTPSEATDLAKKFKTKDLVLKAQILAGGRGKGQFRDSDVSGVVMCETPEQVEEIASSMIGKVLVTKQTGAAGKICNSVMVTTRMFPRKEYYMAVMLERAFDGPVIIVSKQGGINIEEIAATNPEAIAYIPIDVRKGLTSDQADCVADKLGMTGYSKEIVSIIASNLYQLFVEKDALLLEINPFAEDICGEYYALDCKCKFDDSAEYRQKELFILQDISQMDPNEVLAAKYDLNYIALDGNIGCLVNGAGLAMATMDIIQLYYGQPANFLDVGGTATVESVTEAFKILSSDTKGTNIKEAKALISDAKLKVISVDDFAQAAETSVKLASMMNFAKSLDLDISFSAKSLEKEKDNKIKGNK